MITKADAIAARHGQTFYHVSECNADGSAVRCRVNGKCKVWKTRPDWFQLPVKHGLRTCFYISHHNCGDWLLLDPTSDAFLADCADLVGLVSEVPPVILIDKLNEDGHEDLARFAYTHICNALCNVEYPEE